MENKRILLIVRRSVPEISLGVSPHPCRSRIVDNPISARVQSSSEVVLSISDSILQYIIMRLFQAKSHKRLDNRLIPDGVIEMYNYEIWKNM